MLALLCSCSSLKVDYSYFGYIQNALFNNDFEINAEYYEELEFSYLKIKHKDKRQYTYFQRFLMISIHGQEVITKP